MSCLSVPWLAWHHSTGAEGSAVWSVPWLAWLYGEWGASVQHSLNIFEASNFESERKPIDVVVGLEAEMAQMM